MEEEFQVETILDHMSYEQAYRKRDEIGFNPDDKKCNLHSKYVFLVKWEGYNETTWEPESNLEDNIELRKYKNNLNLATPHIRFIATYPWTDNPELEGYVSTQDVSDEEDRRKSCSGLLHNVLQGKRKKNQKKAKKKVKQATEVQPPKKKTKPKKVLVSGSESEAEIETTTRQPTEKNEKHQTDNNNTIRLTRQSSVSKTENSHKKKNNNGRKRSINGSNDEIVSQPAPDCINDEELTKEQTAKRMKTKEKYTVSKPDGKNESDLVFVFKKNYSESSAVNTENNIEVSETKTKSKEKSVALKENKEKLNEKKEKSKSDSKTSNSSDEKLILRGKEEIEKSVQKEKKEGSRRSSTSSLPALKEKKAPPATSKTVENFETTKSSKNQAVAKVVEKEKWKKPKGTKLIGYDELLTKKTTAILPVVDKDRIDRISCKVRETEEKQRQRTLEKEKALRQARENEVIPIVRMVVDPAPRTLMHFLSSKQAEESMKKEAATTDSVKDIWNNRLQQNEAEHVLKVSANRICNILNYLSTSCADGGPSRMNIFMKKSKKHLKWKINDEETKTFMRTLKMMSSIPFRSIPASRPIEVVTLPGDAPETVTVENPVGESVEEKYERNADCLEEAKKVLEQLHINNISLSASQIETVLDIVCAYGCLRHLSLNRFLHNLKGKGLIFLIISIICSTVTIQNNVDKDLAANISDKASLLFSSDPSISSGTDSVCAVNHAKCLTMRTVLQWLPANRRYLDRTSPFYVKKFIKCMKYSSHCQRLAYILGGLPLGYSYDFLANYMYIEPLHIALKEKNTVFLVDLLKLGFDINAFAFKISEQKPGASFVKSEPVPMIQFYGDLEDEEASTSDNLENTYFYRLRSLIVPYSIRLELFCQTETKSFFSRLGAILDYKGPLTPVHVFRSPSAGSINIISSLTYRNVTYIDHDLQFPRNIISLSTVPKGAIKSEQCVVLLAINNVDIVGGECFNGVFRPLAVKRRKTKENAVTSAKLVMQSTKTEIELYKECCSDSLTLFRVPKDHEEDLKLELFHISLSVSGPMNRIFTAQLQLFHVLGN